jgi:hypothetical protein
VSGWVTLVREAGAPKQTSSRFSAISKSTSSVVAPAGGGGDFFATASGKGPSPPKEKTSTVSSLLNSFRKGSFKKGDGAKPEEEEQQQRGDKRILIEKHSKQYELVYPRQQWLQARDATARKEGEGHVYGSEGEIQKAFERLFGQPSSRFIGNSDNLMAC